ncbi:MAG: hypothetical protein MZV70_15170 [Desulfobacterales bacterium]|nr:hypothetical protein [Desulfobacterales bacterium]
MNRGRGDRRSAPSWSACCWRRPFMGRSCGPAQRALWWSVWRPSCWRRELSGCAAPLLPCLLIGVVHAVLLTLQRTGLGAPWLAGPPIGRWNGIWQRCKPWRATRGRRRAAGRCLGGASSGATGAAAAARAQRREDRGLDGHPPTLCRPRPAAAETALCRSPGTYQHSMNVAYLAQAAGDADRRQPAAAADRRLFSRHRQDQHGRRATSRTS